MKKVNLRSFFSGTLVTLLVVGLVGTAAATVGKRQIDVDYKDISVNLDYKPLDLTDANGKTVEPFAYSGTTYVPVRAIATAFGCNVSYREIDGKGYVSLESPKPDFSALNYYYQNTGAPRFDEIVGEDAFFDVLVEGAKQARYLYFIDKFKDGTADSYQTLYQKLLEDNGFKLYKTDVIDGNPLYHYTNDTSGVFMSLGQADFGDSPTVSVMVNTEHMKKESSGTTKPSGTSSGSSGSSSGNTSTSDNTALYNAEKGVLDTRYNSDKAAIESEYKQAYINYMQEMAAMHIGPDSPESDKLAVETNYQSARMAIDKKLSALDAQYNADLALLNARYGK